MDEKMSLKEFLTSTFFDTQETLEIKRYAKSLKELDDFKDTKISFVQFQDNDIFKQRIKLYNPFKKNQKKAISIINFILPRYGSYDMKAKKIYIYIDNQIIFGKIKKIVISISKMKIDAYKEKNVVNKICCHILKTMYHEKRHKLQDSVKDNSFESIMYQIETNIRPSIFGRIKYFSNHDKWYTEIDANNYGVNKTLEYYDNNPQDKHADLQYLLFLKKMYEYDKKMYDFDSFFNAYNIHREKIPFYNNVRNSLSDIFSNNKDMDWHKVLYGNKKRLRNIEEILSDPLISKIDEKFINSVITSKYLNKNIDYANISDEVKEKLLIAFNLKLNECIQFTQDLLKENDKYIIIK